MTVDFQNIQRQAQSQAEDYFRSATSILRDSGLNFNASNVINLANVMAYDYAATSLAGTLGEIEAALARLATCAENNV